MSAAASAPLAELLQLLELEPLEVNLFRGASRDIGSPQVFGGQVLGQALSAAYATVEGRDVHSMHAYFLRRGDFNAPIVYQVDRSRDGGSFSSRRVVAIQHGEQIFHMAASFQVAEEGLTHQIPMPAVPPPESLPDLRELLESDGSLAPAVRRFAGRNSPFEFRAVQAVNYRSTEPAPPRFDVWFRTAGRLGDDARQHRCLLAYVSDYHLIGTAMRPHGLTMASPGVVVASIDHAMWFHRALRVDDWLLYSIESPVTAGSRGFAHASIFQRDGLGPKPPRPTAPAQQAPPRRRTPADQPAARPALAPTPGSVFRDCAECPEMVVVPAGSFLMGAIAAEDAAEQVPASMRGRSLPQHEARIEKPFAVGKFEVTRGEFAMFVRESAYRSGAGCFIWTGRELKEESSRGWQSPGWEQNDRHPVVCVSWEDAKAYAAWLSRRTGKA